MLKTVLFSICLSLLLFVVLLTGMTTQPLLRTPAASSVPAVDPAVLEKHVTTLSQTLHPRSHDHPENLEATARYIEGHFTAAGGRTHRQSFTADGLTYDNIIADFGPQDGPALIIGAHYDSHGETDREPPLYTPGADDNASGVAGLLALADLLGRHPPTGRVQLAAYCLEEPPFFGTAHMGSAAHAAMTHADGLPVIGMIALEMIGHFSDAPGSQTYPADLLTLFYPDAGDFIAVVGRFQDMSLTRTVKSAMLGASDLPVHSLNTLPVVPGVDYSDHKNYWPGADALANNLAAAASDNHQLTWSKAGRLLIFF